MQRPKERADPRPMPHLPPFFSPRWGEFAPCVPMPSSHGRASEAFPEDDGKSDTSDADDGVASDAFDEDDDELRTKLAARRLLVDETEEAIRRSLLETPAASGPSSSREAATDEKSRLRPRQLLAGTPLDHDEDALSHLMGVMGMRLLMIGAAVSKPWRNAARARLGAWRVLSHERVVGAAKLAWPLFGAPLPDGGIVVSENGGARLKGLFISCAPVERKLPDTTLRRTGLP